ncbi:LLM class flavin-dependent oxidoreductase [Paenibacillus sp. GCM10023252]|uniref:LLM class flavin-dependent oxidoreductase n=1 Tax=Paenibacillus sp. GCM10023252 TaxID=3252649 RepID=UPI00361B508B
MAITLSVLDQSPIYPGETAHDALSHTVALAQKVEKLGFRRFWVSEHHDSSHLAGSSPEVLISYLIAKTDSIRLGSGGVMLQHYSPYKVAENFNLLSALAPGRIDLGVGRAPGGLPRSTQALQQGITQAASLTDKIQQLEEYLHNSLPEDHPLAGLQASPQPVVTPELYVLGASVASARITAELGLPYVFSLFINGEVSTTVEAVKAYRESFNHSTGRKPEVIIGLAVLAADTEEEARELATPQKLVKVHLSSGRTVTVSTLEQGEEYGRQANEPFTIEEKEAQIIKGTKDHVRQQLQSLQELTGVEEFIITTNVSSFPARLRSFELLQEAVLELESVS